MITYRSEEDQEAYETYVRHLDVLNAVVVAGPPCGGGCFDQSILDLHHEHPMWLVRSAIRMAAMQTLHTRGWAGGPVSDVELAAVMSDIEAIRSMVIEDMKAEGIDWTENEP
jgi:hypothetical protein